LTRARRRHTVRGMPMCWAILIHLRATTCNSMQYVITTDTPIAEPHPVLTMSKLNDARRLFAKQQGIPVGDVVVTWMGPVVYDEGFAGL
jgi:hypothetical protein